jgi:hypothetical protein
VADAVVGGGVAVYGGGDGLLMNRTEDVIVDFGESDIDGGRPIC